MPKMTLPDASEIWLTSDVARHCGVSSAAVREWERRKMLRAYRTVRGTRLFLREDVERLAKQRERGTTGE